VADLVAVDDVVAHLNLPAAPADPTELQRFIDAATAHVEHHYGTFPSASYTEDVTVVDDGTGTYRYWLRPLHRPITAVTSATDENGTQYTTGFVISTDARRIRHESITSGEWTVVYTAGQATPADLQLAVLEDIRGLYQPGQVGPPAAFGAFGIEDTESGGRFRPVNMWPRVDSWIYSRTGPAIA
jgi:hypothetical protein